MSGDGYEGGKNPSVQKSSLCIATMESQTRRCAERTARHRSLGMAGGILPEQYFQEGSQFENKALRYSASDERARKFCIKKVRRFHPVSEQHYGESAVILPCRPEKALNLRMGSVYLSAHARVAG